MAKRGIGYEQVITELHDVAHELATLDTQEAVYHRLINAAETLLEFDLSIVAVEEVGQLRPKAVSSGLDADEFETMSIHDGIAGKTVRTGEAYLIKDVTEWDEADPRGSWRSALSLPVGDVGNFQAVSEEKGAFDDQDLQLAELLIKHASHHLDRIATKEELERQNDRLKGFASVVAHDLRNPLNVAEGRVVLAKEACDSRHLDAIARAHDRMNQLIDDLLTLARTGDTVGEIEPIDLATLTANCWENVATADATLTPSLERTIHADRSRLQQLVENLMRNAIEHGGEDVTVTVGPLHNGFYIEDDGPGIPDDERDEVFTMGYSTGDEGTGFGLAIAKQVADAHDWQIHATDGSSGGARFEITNVEFVAE